MSNHLPDDVLIVLVTKSVLLPGCKNVHAAPSAHPPLLKLRWQFPLMLINVLVLVDFVALTEPGCL